MILYQSITLTETCLAFKSLTMSSHCPCWSDTYWLTSWEILEQSINSKQKICTSFASLAEDGGFPQVNETVGELLKSCVESEQGETTLSHSTFSQSCPFRYISLYVLALLKCTFHDNRYFLSFLLPDAFQAPSSMPLRGVDVQSMFIQ